MSFLTASLRRGEYCATCLRVLGEVSGCKKAIGHGGSLLSDAIKRGIVVEAKVTGVNDVVGSCVACEFVQGSEIACLICSVSVPSSSSVALSAHLARRRYRGLWRRQPGPRDLG
jgi:hypothetical protein